MDINKKIETNQKLEEIRKLEDRYIKSEQLLKLFKSEKNNSTQILIESLINHEEYYTELDYEINLDLVTNETEEKRKNIISGLIEIFENSPLSDEGQWSAYALGEIVRIQLFFTDQSLDARILPTFIKVGESILTKASTEQLHFMSYSLLQLANSGPLPETEKFMRDILEIAKKENDEDLDILTLGHALELLYLNNGEVFIEEISSLISNLNKDSEFANYLDLFLIEKQEEFDDHYHE